MKRDCQKAKNSIPGQINFLLLSDLRKYSVPLKVSDHGSNHTINHTLENRDAKKEFEKNNRQSPKQVKRRSSGGKAAFELIFIYFLKHFILHGKHHFLNGSTIDRKAWFKS